MAMVAALPQEGKRLAEQTFGPNPVFPKELIVEILSWVPVKDLIRFRCVSKSWNSLMFDPTFVKLQLQRSSKNTHILLSFIGDIGDDDWAGFFSADATPCSIRSLLENPSSIIDDCVSKFNGNHLVLGSCNGLVCLRNHFFGDEMEEHWVRFWNPTTRVMSKDSPRLRLHSSNYEIGSHVTSGFGFDDSRDIYKVVITLLDVKSQEREVRVHSMGDTRWRKIITGPAFPILGEFDGQFVSGTVNWLALRTHGIDYDWESVTFNQLVIFSFDLKTETDRYLLMPDGIVEDPLDEPYLSVLKGCLCLSHDDGSTHFVVWIMREFGRENSWTQLLSVSYSHLLPTPSLPPCEVKPLCMSESEELLLLVDYEGRQFVVYNRRDNRIQHTGAFNKYKFLFFSYDYVQSLVLPYAH